MHLVRVSSAAGKNLAALQFHLRGSRRSFDLENYFHLQLSGTDLTAVSALGLAHVGDAVFELLVRSYLCAHGKATSKNLHKATVRCVSAPAQAQRMERMLPFLTPEELAQSGIRPNTIRLSIGTEPIDDILADLAAALEA